MLRGTSGDTGGPGLAVPLGWWCAEYTADEVLRSADLVDRGTVEFRAGLHALALTVHLCEGARPPSPADAGPRSREWLAVTAHGHPWSHWAARRLGERAQLARSGVPDPDLGPAAAAWEWLRGTEVHAADLGGLGEPCSGAPSAAGTAVDEGRRVWTPAWRIGVPLGHLAVGLW
ncbi:hypothetical protein NPS70_21360 [Streptomyces sp. C10-9-1]|uniref:hypothetical protein n=1 Tax=Streptomyces sp. C10-9-1 TaxID=1859285 RepID=UPI00211344C2|nr:hypothetical protein [Streptomyces sp. C10-9-1]MCQ6555725.1 hypothetical protein [Streptomyces sp. C10-9-1]